MEVLIDSWEWIAVGELSHYGMIYMSAVAAAIIFKLIDKFKKPKK